PRPAPGSLRAGVAQGQPGVQPRLGAQALAVPRAGRAADRYARLPRADPAPPHPGPGAVPGQPDPDLPRGQPDELQRAPRDPGGEHPARGLTAGPPPAPRAGALAPRV